MHEARDELNKPGALKEKAALWKFTTRRNALAELRIDRPRQAGSVFPRTHGERCGVMRNGDTAANRGQELMANATSWPRELLVRSWNTHTTCD